MTPEERYLAYFGPIARDLALRIQALGYSYPAGTPEPFFPCFGTEYFNQTCRIVVVGRDTCRWGDLTTFLKRTPIDAYGNLRERLGEFQAHAFVNRWERAANTTYRFFGFVLLLLAELHGVPDWRMLRRLERLDILSSFAWANCNAVELFQSSPRRPTRAEWEAVRLESMAMNRFSHLIATLEPTVVIVLSKCCPMSAYFQGYAHDSLPADGILKEFVIRETGTRVFQVLHPGAMRWQRISPLEVAAQIAKAIGRTI